MLNKINNMPTLADETLRLLKNRHRQLTFDMIATELPEITVAWLSMFNRGKIPDPSVNKIQALYEYLSGNKLQY